MRLLALSVMTTALGVGCAPPARSTSGATGPGACAAELRVSQVSGRVQDDVGIPTARAQVQLCLDNGTCLPPVDTDHAGVFVVAVPPASACMTSGTVRVMHGGSATTYCSLPTDRVVSGQVRLPRPLIVHRTAPATTLPIGAGVVEFGGGVRLEADPAQVDPGAFPQIAARTVDPTQLCDPLQFDGAIAFSPELDVRAGGFDLHVQTRLEPLTTVALFVRGGQRCTLADGTRPPEAEWADYGTGIVDRAGILHATGTNGLPCLGWLAWHVIDEGDPDRRPPEVDLPPVEPEPAPGPDPEGQPDVVEPPTPDVDPDTLPRPAPPNPATAPEFRAIDLPAETGAAVIEVLGPRDGEVHLAADPLEVVANVFDTEGLAVVDLVWAKTGERYPCPTSGAGVTCVVDGDRHTWTLMGNSAGPHGFSVRARNSRGRVTRTPDRVADVRARLDAEPPRIAILDPTPDTTWRANGVVQVVSRITDDGSVASAEILWAFNGNRYPCPHQSQYVDCAVSGDRYTWDIQVSTGTRAFQIEARDDEGNTTLSPTRSLDLQE